MIGKIGFLIREIHQVIFSNIYLWKMCGILVLTLTINRIILNNIQSGRLCNDKVIFELRSELDFL